MKFSAPRLLVVLVLGLNCLAVTVTGKTVDLGSAGAQSGDPAPATALIQQAIDEVAAAGGGTVVVVQS